MRYARIVSLMVVVACSKSADYKKETGSAAVAKPATGSASGSAQGSASAEPAEAAEVSGPTKSAAGTVEVSGAIAGTFGWKKQDQRAPITCIWDPDKEIGTLKIDVSDGAGHLLTLGVDVPPTDVGVSRVDITSKDLPGRFTTYFGITMKGDSADAFTVAFDGADAVTDPDAQMKAKSDKKKKAEPPPDPHVTLKGTLEVTCPKKK